MGWSVVLSTTMVSQSQLLRAGTRLMTAGQHNDSRMNISLALTAVQHGAVMANHLEVTKLHKKADASRGGVERICAADVRDQMTGEEWTVKCRVSQTIFNILSHTDRTGCH